MIEINLFDSAFEGRPSSVATQTPTTMRYVHRQLNWDGITVFTNEWMHDPTVDWVRTRYKVGWITGDARCLRPHWYERALDVAPKFDAIMTHDAELLNLGAPFVKTIRGGSWVLPEQWGLYPKTKNVSMILSDKTTLPGHQLRHAIAAAGLPIDLYGPGYTPIGHDKALAYRDYRYAVVVEACQEVNWFTEHLIDALAFGCVPIYWGCPNYHEYFDYTALGELVSIDQLTYLCREANWTRSYDGMVDAVERNQATAHAYAITEDWQVANCLHRFVEAQ